MSRQSLTWPRRHRAVWERPAADTRLLPHPFPKPVSLGSPRSPLRKSLAASAPSQSPVRKLPAPPYSRPARAAYARSALRGVDADACVNSWMNARSALPASTRMPALTPRMNARSALPGVDADACVNSWMNACSALPGVDADACANPADDLFRPDPSRPDPDHRGSAGNPHPFHPDAPRGISHARPAIHPPGRCETVGAGLVPALPDRRGAPHTHEKEIAH